MSYKKGSDLKQQGDCLCYCYTRRIELIGFSNSSNSHLETNGIERHHYIAFKPEGFETIKVNDNW